MSFNSLPSERAAILGAIDPDAYSAATYASGWIRTDKHERFMVVNMVGDIAATGTVNVKIQKANTATGGGATDVSGKAITQLTAAATDSNQQAIINLRNDELDGNSAYNWFRVHTTIGTAACDYGAVVFGFDPKHKSAADNDASSVTEIVA